MLPAGPGGLTPHPYPCGVPTTDGCILDHLQLDNQATEDEHGFDASCLYVEHLTTTTTTTNTLSVTFMKKKEWGTINMYLVVQSSELVNAHIFPELTFTTHQSVYSPFNLN